MNTTTDTMLTTSYALHGAERRATMKDRIILTFLDVPNGKEVLVKVPEELDRDGFATFIMTKLGENPTYVLINVTMF